MEYNQYCLLEEKLSNIIRSYLESRKNYLFVFENENWLQDESIISYYTQEERKHIDRYTIVNLDILPKINTIPPVPHKIFFWNKFNHPHI